MADTLNLSSKARDILATRNHGGLAIVVDQLFFRQESEEYKTARALFDFFVSDFPNCLTLKLLKVYQSSSNAVTRFRSIYQLSETLADFRNRKCKLSLDALEEIKPLLISCLTMQNTKESDIKILRRIVYFVAYDVLILNHGKWDELSDCILWLANEEPVKAFHVFLHLPPLYESFIDKFSKVMLEKAEAFLLNPEQSGVKDWSLALETVVKLGIQLLNTRMSFEDVKSVLRSQLLDIVNSAKELVKKRKEQLLFRGLEDFERFLLRDMNLYHYTEKHCQFVSMIMSKIRQVGKETMTGVIVRKINKVVAEPSCIQTLKDHGGEFYSDWFYHLKNLSALEVLKIFASNDLEDRSREIAIGSLRTMLSDQVGEILHIDISEMRQLQPLLMLCLKQEGLSDNMFRFLGQVINQLVCLMSYEKEDIDGNDLRDYIASQSKEKFERAVYVFQCFTMPLEEGEFVISMMENLLPEISTRLNPPTEVLVDNSCWVSAFVGAFCASIHLIEIPSHAVSVNEIAHKMIDSVRELVESGMEVGLVRRAFREVEIIVKNQLYWYGPCVYKFVKGLLWRLYGIKGMKWESKVVLWRINLVLERALKGKVKYTPEEDERDWLNVGDEEDDSSSDSSSGSSSSSSSGSSSGSSSDEENDAEDD